MKKICVVTATRAEYSLLKNVIKKIQQDIELELCLVVTGAHLVKSFGNTVKEIEEDGIPITERIHILMAEDSEAATSKSMGMAFILFSEMFERQRPDLMIVLGDRYELLPICGCALTARVPIAHISGGETTEGAIDECIRHCITKMSYLHFPACEIYKKRVIQLGENPDRVFNFGDLGIENLEKTSLLSRQDLEDYLKCDLSKPYMAVTVHPATLSEESPGNQIREVLRALELFPDLQFLFTKANADPGGRIINHAIEEYVNTHENGKLYDSLGGIRYLSLLKYSSGILGNSSSGIIEAPSLGIPTINIGERQKGRLLADSIINCKNKQEEIQMAVNMALTSEFRKKARYAVNPYQGGDTAEKIVNQIKKNLDKPHCVKKTFYDVSF